ncbi:protein kinase C delta type-like [Engystomops pustulosus]|uniref:protein kinase C delta type-like n=1 Tax=Engystomops pustulosus TaxID=76066 RepID=UPI003AFA8A53
MSPPSRGKGGGMKRKRESEGDVKKRAKRSSKKDQNCSKKYLPMRRNSRALNSQDRADTERREKTGEKRKLEDEEMLTKKKKKLDEYREALPSTSINPRGLSQFKIHQELARGGFGIVYLASTIEKKTMVAIKAIAKRKQNASLLTEKSVLLRSSGKPYLCQVYSGFQNDIYGFLAMEYLPGGDLEEVLAVEGALDVKTTVLCTAEILCGIQHLHKLGVIHRDIKAENILIDRRGHIRICDFGVAAENVFGIDMISGFCGTQTYMAPEILNKDYYDSAVDWWAFGVLLHHLMTNSFPFEEVESAEEFREIVMSKEPTFPKNMTKEAKDIVAKILCKEKRRRLRWGVKIKQHPFYNDVSWEKVENQTIEPPFLHRLKSNIEVFSSPSLVLSSQQAPKGHTRPEVCKSISNFSFDLSEYSI